MTIADSTPSHPTETSPLLDEQFSQNATRPVEPGGGIAPEGAAEFHDESGEAADDDENGQHDLERQVSNGDASKHQGMPEVKKRMKFIFPAIAIGVSYASLARRRIC